MNESMPVQLLTHARSRTTKFAVGLKITRADGEVYGLTSARAGATIDGVYYSAIRGLDSSAITTSAGYAVEGLEMTVSDGGSIFTPESVDGGLWRNAAFAFFRYRWDLPSAGIEPLSAGVFGNVELRRGQAVVELRDLRQYLQQALGSVTSRPCRARFADYPARAGRNRCGLSAADYIDTLEVTAITSRRAFRALPLGLEDGGDADFPKVKFGLHYGGANDSTDFVDVIGNTITVNGSAKITTAQSVFGGSSGRFDGSGYIVVPFSAGIALGGVQYTLATRLRFDSVPGSPQVLMGQNNYGVSGEWDIRLRTDGKIQLTEPSGAAIVLSGVLSAATWYALEITDDGTTTRMFIDGALVASSTTRITGSTKDLGIGAATNGNAKFTGHLDETRLWIGVAKHTAGYTVDTAAFSDSSGPDSTRGDDWFAQGVATFTTGANAGVQTKVISYTGTGDFELLVALPSDLQVGDQVQVIAGCRGRRDEDCLDKFDNVLNFQGEPDLPGVDALASTPLVQA